MLYWHSLIQIAIYPTQKKFTRQRHVSKEWYICNVCIRYTYGVYKEYMQCTTYNGHNAIASTVTRMMCVWQCTAYVSIICNRVCVLGFGTCVDNLIKIRQCWFDTIYFDSIVDTHIMWIDDWTVFSEHEQIIKSVINWKTKDKRLRKEPFNKFEQ